ncbi:MAG: hypothetical protein RIE73_00980 [Coleofasciculus sp. C1-SOL-03]|uniref:hypothetical protein n=1 Tax=Coleofasciculus sp. C1-SOL-03 TaxID=3069522 RepID=UPI0032FBE5D2
MQEFPQKGGLELWVCAGSSRNCMLEYWSKRAIARWLSFLKWGRMRSPVWG